MNYEKDSPKQVEQDAKDFRNLTQEYGNEQREEVTEARMNNIMESARTLYGKNWQRKQFSLELGGELLSVDIGRESVTNEEYRIQIRSNKMVKHELILGAENGKYYASYLDYTYTKNPTARENGTFDFKWRKPEGSTSSRFNSKDATEGIQELKYIEKILSAVTEDNLNSNQAAA